MCDLKPGDEVVCVDAKARHHLQHQYKIPLVEGQVYIVSGLASPGEKTGKPRIRVAGIMADWHVSRFRKVQRRKTDLTIEAFSVIKDGGFEEPKRTPAPAKKRERV